MKEDSLILSWIASYLSRFRRQRPNRRPDAGIVQVYLQKVNKIKSKRQTHKRSGQKLEFQNNTEDTEDPNLGTQALAKQQYKKQGRAGIHERTQLIDTELSPC